ncbi:MAG: hypothetical protein R3E08_09690 [Thiotrichaceae bacterium]
MLEPKCVIIKRQGSQYVSQLLANKTIEEQLEFWQKRTEALLLLQSQRLESNPIKQV